MHLTRVVHSGIWETEIINIIFKKIYIKEGKDIGILRIFFKKL